ncbi:MAG TPA: EF-hand domain-containing protein [Patescibacteria group bacterium]|nr:EF-hand domain-containing protein [Patescibacteria group bacterium]
MKNTVYAALGLSIGLATAAPAISQAQMPLIRNTMDTLTRCDAGGQTPAFNQVDIDRDGKINYREIKTADRAEAQSFEKIDTGKDGYISRAELSAHEAATGGCVN